VRQIRSILAVVALVLVAGAYLLAAGSRWSLTIKNQSKFDIYELFISSSEAPNWGRDLLGSDVLRSGSSWTIQKVMTGEYDVKFVDEDGDTCILRNTQLTKDTAWDLTTNWLLRCEFHQTGDVSR
jgi:hypothetical protein